MTQPDRQIYRFAYDEGRGVFAEVDTSRPNSLSLGGRESHLRQQTFQVLVLLLEGGGRVVGKRELMARVWRGTSVTDDALVQCVKEIRRALGDDPHDPRFVKTVSRVGYGFIPAVEVERRRAAGPPAAATEVISSVEYEYEEEYDERLSTPGAESKTLPPPAPQRLGRAGLAAAALLAVAVVSLAGYFESLSRSGARGAAESPPPLPGRRPLAVMRFDNQSDDASLDWLREGLADMLTTGLSRSEGLIVIGRQQLRTPPERAGRGGGDDSTSLDDALAVARRARAEVLVLGGFARLGRTVRLDARLHDAYTGRLLAAESAVADGPEQILTQVDLLALKLADRLGARPPAQDQPAALSEVMTDNLEAYRLYTLALGKTRGFENKEAIALLERAVALDPRFAMAHARIGYTYAVTWNYGERAKTHLERAFQLSDRLTERDRLYITAWYAIANLDYAGAVAPLRQIIARHPEEAEAYERLGALLLSLGRYEEAVAVARAGLVVDPEATRLYNLLGNIYLGLGRGDEALAMYQRYVQLAPSEPNAHDSLGLGYQRVGRHAEAEAAYGRALELKPDFEVALVHLANLRFQQGRYREAAGLYRKYVAIAPSEIERARGYACLATIHLRKGDLARAADAASLEARSGRNTLWGSLMLAYARGDKVAGRRLGQRVLEERSYTHRGARPPLRGDYHVRGYVALREGRGEEALGHFKEALRHPPLTWNIEDLEDCLAGAYLELGRLDEAAAEYERVLRINPNYPLAHYRLAQVYERMGQPERARALYEQFLRVWKDADADIPEVFSARNYVSR